MTSVNIVDYGAGNLESLRNAFTNCGAEVRIASTPDEVQASDRIVLPGVGAAGSAMDKLRKLSLDEALDDTVRRRGRPMLGICLGLQLLGRDLFEFGPHRGLGWLNADVRHLSELMSDEFVIPHTGWQEIEPTEGFFSGFAERRFFYFNHSYALCLAEEHRDVIVATVNYGVDVVAAVRHETVFAAQFHPEISQRNGRKFLNEFLCWQP